MPGEHAVERDRLAACLDRGHMDTQQRDEPERNDPGGGSVDDLGSDREEKAAERGAGDRRHLERDRADRHRTWDQLERHHHRGQRPSSRRAERACDADCRSEREERPELMCARGRNDDQQGDDDERDRLGECEDEPPRDAVGELPGRQREHEQRHELGQADQPEVERGAVDRIHLPADRDRRHLRAEPAREDRDPEECEVALLQREWEAPTKGHASHPAVSRGRGSRTASCVRR